MERPDGGSNAGGFDFEFVKRNAMLAAKGVKPPTAWKTGTTIAGVIYKVNCMTDVLVWSQHSACVEGRNAAAQPNGRCNATCLALQHAWLCLDTLCLAAAGLLTDSWRAERQNQMHKCCCPSARKTTRINSPPRPPVLRAPLLLPGWRGPGSRHALHIWQHCG